MLKIETIKNFEGFGDGKRPGEYFYSQGMTRGKEGLAVNWGMSKQADDAGLTNLNLNYWISEGKLSGTNYVYAMDYNGRIWRKTLGGAWAFVKLSTADSYAGYNGMIFDQKNRLIYVGQRYVGMSTNPIDAGGTWTDTWKDLGSNILSLKQPSLFEDFIFIPFGNKIAAINTTDDSINLAAFTLPSGFDIRSIKVNANGVIIGANINGRSVIVLWNGYDTRAKTEWLWLKEEVRSIVNSGANWIVITTRRIYLTNGYSIKPLVSKIIDSRLNNSTITDNLLPQGAEVVDDKYLLFWGTSQIHNRLKSGLYILNLENNLFDFAPSHNGVLSNNFVGGAIYTDSNFDTNLSYKVSSVAGTFSYFLSILTVLINTKGIYITPKVGQGVNTKIAEAIRVVLGVNSEQYNQLAITFNITAKIAILGRPLWGYAQQKVLATTYNQIMVDGTVSANFKAQIGDEIIILNGINAGEIRNITNITGQGTVTEIWTLDSILPNYTEANALINVSPFKLIKKYSFTNLNEIKDVFFDIKNKIKGKKFLIKIIIDNMSAPLDIQEINFIYDDQGVY